MARSMPLQASPASSPMHDRDHADAKQQLITTPAPAVAAASPTALAAAAADEWWALSLSALERELSTSFLRGLSVVEAATRLSLYGPNELSTRARPPLWRVFLANCTNGLLVILMASATLSLALGDYPEGIAILFIVLLNATLATYTEKSSGDALAALLQMTAPTCRVRRNAIGGKGLEAVVVEAPQELPTSGPNRRSLRSLAAQKLPSHRSVHEQLGIEEVVAATILSKDLVVGDIVLLESGSVIAADIRLIEGADISVDESMLTGESKEIGKNPHWLPEGSSSAAAAAAGGEGHLSPINMVFSGTNMLSGRAVGVVVATGTKTCIGRIARLLLNADGDAEGADEPPAASASKPLMDSPTSNTPPKAGSPELRRMQSMRLSKLTHDVRRDVPNMHEHAVVDASLRTISSSTRNQALAHLQQIQVVTDSEGSAASSRPAQGSKASAGASKANKKSSGSSSKEQTALQRELSNVGVRMSLGALIACIIVFVIGLGRDYYDPQRPDEPGWLVMLLIAVSLAVSAIPEGLPLAITICLAMGSSRLAKAKTLVRQLPAVENLGTVSVVCSDKTVSQQAKRSAHDDEMRCVACGCSQHVARSLRLFISPA